MKVMKAMKKVSGEKPLSKGAIVKQIAESNDLKTKEVKIIIEALAELGTKEIKRVSKFTVPNLCMIKTRVKPATKAGKKNIFSKEVMVKARPAKTVVKAFPVSILKKQF